MVNPDRPPNDPTRAEQQHESLQPQDPDELLDTSLEETGPTPEDIRRFQGHVFETLGLDPQTPIEKFPEALRNALRELPHFQQLVTDLAEFPTEQLPFELFHRMQKAHDPEMSNDPNRPMDGVLLTSMQEGHLECAGRVAIASTFLQERGIPHAVISAPGHSMLLVEHSDDSLIYMDPNNDLAFTLPRLALRGYQGLDTTSECRLESFTPSSGDTVEGIGTAFNHFFTLPPSEGVGRQYLGNVAAALRGRPEFESTGIEQDRDATKGRQDTEEKIYGAEDPRLLDFSKRSRENLALVDKKHEAFKGVVMQILETHPKQTSFADTFGRLLEGSLGDELPYIQRAPLELRKQYAQKLWAVAQNKEQLDRTYRSA